MADRKMYAFTSTDIERVDELVELANAELTKLSMKKANRTTMLRALIFAGKKIKTEDLIDGIKQAQIYA